MTTQPHSLISRSEDLCKRALVTDQLSHRDHDRMHNLLDERKEALRLLREHIVKSEAQTLEFAGLESRVFELVGLLVRGPNGHDWRKDLPPWTNPSEFYQKAKALAKWAVGRSRASQ